MKDFVAIDFEAANNARGSACSVGIVVVRNGEVEERFYSLIKPEPNYYTYWCTKVHGLTNADTDDAPVFPDVWQKVEPLLRNGTTKDGEVDYLPLVAHNSQFDESCLKAVFRIYQMDYPDYKFYDTLRASRKLLPDVENHQLHTVAAACGYCLEHHHHALADAEACAAIAIALL